MSENEVTPEDITHQFNSEAEASLFAIARDGLAADSFLRSSMGKMIIKRSQQEVDKLSLALINATIEEVPELQAQAKIAVRALSWIADVVAQGDMAHQQLKDMDNG